MEGGSMKTKRKATRRKASTARRFTVRTTLPSVKWRKPRTPFERFVASDYGGSTLPAGGRGAESMRSLRQSIAKISDRVTELRKHTEDQVRRLQRMFDMGRDK
jgi:hypothetical protein